MYLKVYWKYVYRKDIKDKWEFVSLKYIENIIIYIYAYIPYSHTYIHIHVWEGKSKEFPGLWEYIES